MIDEFIDQGLIAEDHASTLKLLLRYPTDLLPIAETIKSAVPHEAYMTFLREQFSYVPVTPAPVHSHLINLNAPIILTTNYDRLIEETFAHVNRRLPNAVQYTNPSQVRHSLLNAGTNNSPCIVKLHGDVTCPSDIVLTTSDYERLKSTQHGYRLLLSSLFFHYTTLFVGFSLSDQEILLHIRNVHDALSGDRLPDYALLAADSCSDEQAQVFRRNYGIHIIRYANSDGEHSEIDNALLELLGT